MQALLLAMKGMLLWAGLLSGVTLSAACMQMPERPRTFTGTWLVDGSLGKTPVTPSHLTAQPPRVAVVLGGGGLRGYAHIGVLQALDQQTGFGSRPVILPSSPWPIRRWTVPDSSRGRLSRTGSIPW